MNHLHYEFDAGPDDPLEVTLIGKANVLLLDDDNYQKYQIGRRYAYAAGGFATISPVYLYPPRQGHWHVVVDLGGHAGTVRAAVRQLDEQPSVD